MKPYRMIPIKVKMIVFFLILILVPICTMFINSYLSSQQLLERKYTDLLMDVSRQANIRIEEFLADTQQISLISSYGINSYVSAISQENYPMQNYLHNPSKNNEDQATQLLMNYITMKDRAFSIYIYNLNGGKDLYVSSNKPIDYTFYPGDEEWFRQFLLSDAITIDVPTLLDQQTKGENNWSIYNARKIFDMDDGKLLGIMVISIDINFINKLNKRLQESSRSAFTVVDASDNVIFNSNYELLGRPFSEVFPINTETLRDDRQIVRADGKDYILIRSSFEKHDWTTYLYMPVDELAVEGDILKRNLMFIVVVLVIFAFISSFYFSNLITRPIKRLMSNMTLVEQGKFENLPEVKSNDEIGLLAIRFEHMSTELKQLVDRIYQEQQEKTDAEIRALQAQINPHFLYNTLNSVKWIASMQRSEKIVEMTEALISLLRYSARTENRLVTIREELDNIRHYITIQKVRYFNRINVQYDLDDTLLDCQMLKLSIQPLVENAIFHGIADTEEEGLITISVQAAGINDIEIKIEDNGKGMDDDTSKKLRQKMNGQEPASENIGVRNVHSRLERVFGYRYGLQFTSKPGSGTLFTITIPKKTGGERLC
ncbi:sensor histidine kinase [Paenibacillus sp. NEAU-GSW1]|uniref:cache domain-containing sensor histidine kinase n=1 Tax=Paenibacillus sp. NEAU-GSW1 TaxID=2682486 RepID=UPI0012E2E640|nr:sensor histidine kinase [Paenibacillus sp. NEAU-GSW1]MUT68263.1 HAMP domain-containing protein [Paenibacillus sp. NEAU-GSW1]